MQKAVQLNTYVDLITWKELEFIPLIEEDNQRVELLSYDAKDSLWKKDEKIRIPERDKELHLKIIVFLMHLSSFIEAQKRRKALF